MRSFHFPILFCAFLLGGCASRGVIVQKEERPHPFYLSSGVEGIYAFILRDETGATHRQMVTPDVFDSYAIGDNFDDQAPAPAANDVQEPKSVQVAMNRPAPSTVATASAPVASVKPQTATKPKVAHKSTQTKTTKIASSGTKKKTPHAKSATKALEEDLAATPAKESDTVSGPSKTSKPWRLGTPNLEMTNGNSSVVIPPPGDAPPPRPVEVPIPKPTPGQTQVETPHSP